ncbi:KAP family P-loop NTPase fold protein [Halanaerobacter jeridensis]|uniref:KAP NTPase domain-containing protein n=1 Tax=Halanaerobacter jeridensis TaxID=706427 RepID=A0A939BQG0_9FIRM|nr:P-loop NTPase fold protein [Halanaerobacter jeridensis]MBM7558113.1 hypothetical protein [Halanaerobacter jeridensis]
MRLKSPEIQVEENSPFEKDVLNRRESAEILTNLVSSTEKSFVLAINSEWGTGKTTFLRMWEKYLENKGFTTLFFNAWRNDFSNDALVSLIGEIETAIKEVKKEHDEISDLERYMEKIKDTGTTLMKDAIPTTLKIATSGIIDLNNATEDDIAKLTQNIASNQIKKHEEAKNTIEQFKEYLFDFADEITKIDGEDGKPLIFFIDELDRCRPNYALEILENAKHFFNVDNIIFVLGIDKNQIGNSIKAIYGSGMEADGYLRRFIDLNYSLPKPEKGLFAKALFNKFGFSEYFKSRKNHSSKAKKDKEYFLKSASELFNLFDFSLRVREQCFSQMSIVFKTIPKDKYLYPTLLTILVSLKNYDNSLYQDYVKGEVGSKKLLSYLKELSNANEFFSDEPRGHDKLVESHLIYYDQTNEKDDIIGEYEEVRSNSDEFNFTREERILELIGHHSSNHHTDKPDYLVEKIEITDRFTDR